VRRRTAWLETRLGRLLAGALAAKAVHAALTAGLGPAVWLEVIGLVISAALLVALIWGLVRLLAYARRRFLWRVRRKLILSYVFIGFVPLLLIIAFFLIAALLTAFQLSAYLVKRGVDDMVDDVTVVAQTAAAELTRSPGTAVEDILERKRAHAATRYPRASLVLVPRVDRARGAALARAVGPWDHDAPPEALPAWIGSSGFSGLVAAPVPDADREPGLVIRAVGIPEDRQLPWAVIVDVPVDEPVLAELQRSTGIDLTGVGVVPPGAGQGEASTRARTVPLVTRPEAEAQPRAFTWMTIIDYRDWTSGRNGALTLSMRFGLQEIYNRITGSQSRLGGLSWGEVFMLVLGILASLFLIIWGIALVMGFALARSITGSIHQLFVGTERVRLGDFTHRIRVITKDQLGELADSFNEMTSSIQELLRQREEKRRLEEELRIAREIQMSLLPRGALHAPGLAITALCVPAREVGGDYYDIFHLDGGRLGLLVADVAGKGTSAALYMAELKGLMLALSKTIGSPKQLLIEVNDIISENLDRRSFITMTYAVVDSAERTFTYARAGHTPLLYLPGGPAPRRAQLLAPPGLVVGLRIEEVSRTFDRLLVESTLPMCEGDLFVLFTDGITEAMNVRGDLFEDARLLALVEEHGDESTEVLRERILREIQAFVGDADQHDDMTMILVKVEGGAVSR
jgi:sigma-B regulation protein RsbU (phosphoserine phosphatase)